MSREQFLHNKIFTITKHTNIVNHNLPPFYDIILQILPDCQEDEQSGLGLAYQSAVVDFQTGSVTEFLIQSKSTITGDIATRVFDRDNYNKLLEFSMLIEGRYLGFWTSLMLRAYEPLMYMAPYFPDLGAMESIFGMGPDGEERRYFFCLNWGQRELFQTNKDRILAIYANGFRKCFWTKINSIDATPDPRILKVNIMHHLPNIYLHDVDIIADYMYVKSKTDEIAIEYITGEIADVRLQFEADIQNAYHPWVNCPPCYPDV